MPKDGTVHELTSNVGAAQGHLGRGGVQPGPEPHMPSPPVANGEREREVLGQPEVWNMKFAATLFTGQTPGPALAWNAHKG